jgi:hypothetical protein
MASRDDLENKKDILQLSRRRAFVWAGQVAAGLSLAGAGLGFLGARPLPAMAANQAGQAAAGSVKPDCVPCPPYGTLYSQSCELDSNCIPGPYIFVAHYYSGGCVPAGQRCPTYVCAKCVSSCTGASC